MKKFKKTSKNITDEADYYLSMLIAEKNIKDKNIKKLKENEITTDQIKMKEEKFSKNAMIQNKEKYKVVDISIVQLIPGKSPGFDGLQSEFYEFLKNF